MDTTAGDIRIQVTEILHAAGVTFTARYIGETTRDSDWKCDEWRCTFERAQAIVSSYAPRAGGPTHVREEFEFYMGLGNRAEPTPQAKMQARMCLPGLTQNDIDRRTIYGRRYLAEVEKLRKPEAPHAADVLHSILLDSSAVGQSFADWCSDYGYGTDSRKALATYEACQQGADKLARIFNAEQRATLADALSEY
jgi:hypothetical protein